MRDLHAAVLGVRARALFDSGYGMRTGECVEAPPPPPTGRVDVDVSTDGRSTEWGFRRARGEACRRVVISTKTRRDWLARRVVTSRGAWEQICAPSGSLACSYEALCR